MVFLWKLKIWRKKPSSFRDKFVKMSGFPTWYKIHLPTTILHGENTMTEVFNYKEFRMKLIRQIFSRNAEKLNISDQFVINAFLNGTKEHQDKMSENKCEVHYKKSIGINCSKGFDNALFGRFVIEHFICQQKIFMQKVI